MADPSNKFREALQVLRDARERDKLRRLYFEEPSWEQNGSPYPWQAEFHSLGSEHRERALICANQIGKSFTCAAEVAIHLTGHYPPWWEGHRFDRPIEALVSGQTNKKQRDINQTKLVGKIDDERSPDGTGWIPHDCLGKPAYQQTGIRNTIESIRVKHVSGGFSTLEFLAYESGGSKFQGVQHDLWWPDEEPDHEADREMIWSEARRGLINKGGILIFSRTPLYGMSTFVGHFLDEGHGAYINAGMDEAPHMGPEEREEYLASLPPHERETRERGVPMLGSGAVFPVPDESILCEPFEVPRHFGRGIGLDFGIDHPAAVACLAHDRDSDVIYLIDEWKQKGTDANTHAGAASHRAGRWVPVFYPHDGDTREKGGGHRLISLYQPFLPTLHPKPASWDDEKRDIAFEPGIHEMLVRMREGRFRVFSTCQSFMKEKRQYHRKEGKVNPINDDLIDAARTGLMMLRHFSTPGEVDNRQPYAVEDYDPIAEYTGA